jgi:hypothetical protein
VRRKPLLVFLVAAVWIVCSGAGTGGRQAFDAATLPSAFPESDKADRASLVTDLQRKLPSHMSVITHGHLIVAASGSMEDAVQQGSRIARYDEQMRRRSFPQLESRPVIIVLAEDSAALGRLAKTLYPTVSPSELPSSGFYHGEDRLILASSSFAAGANGDGALRRQLMRALVQDDNPQAPRWFEEAAATLYESSESYPDRLTPTLDRRMEQIRPDEDLSYDVFAGICDCSPVSSEQLALMRLLLIFFDQRNELTTLHTAIKQQGQYTTLLQALEAMNFDRAAWKNFAESSVRTYSR